MVKKKVILYVLFAVAVALIVGPIAMADEGEKIKTFHRASWAGNVVMDKPIEIAKDIQGVKVESIYFSGDQALIIVWNRTPKLVKANVGVALFDQHNNLLASEADSHPIGIRSGKQGNFKIKFKKFLADCKEAARFHLVFVIVK